MSRSTIKREQIRSLDIVNADILVGAAIETVKLADGLNFIKKDGSVEYTADQSMGNNKITNIAPPVNPNDAARLIDVQNAQSGFSFKDAARVATTANITLSSAQTIDGISLANGDRVLVKNQTNASQNGIYVVATGAWTRSTDADTSGELKSGTQIFIQEGTINADSQWALQTDGVITIGTTNQTWIQTNGLGQISAGAGLTKTGNQLDVGGSAGRIVVGADNIDLATTGVTAGTYTKVTLDAYGRATAGTTATPADIGAQPANDNLTNLSSISGIGIYVSTGTSTNTVRTLTGTAGRISIANGNGASGNPTIDLIASGVTAGTYNSVTVDIYGRVTSASNVAVIQQSRYIVREIPTGATNGTNTVFTLANTPVLGKEMVFLNGQLLEPGVGNDYTISGATVTMLYTPATGDIIRVTYFY